MGCYPSEVYKLLPGMGWRPLNWNADLLPDHMRICLWCEGKGVRRQLYTVGCGGGSYHSEGECDSCEGAGVKFHFENPFVPDRTRWRLSAAEIGAAVQAHKDFGIEVSTQ